MNKYGKWGKLCPGHFALTSDIIFQRNRMKMSIIRAQVGGPSAAYKISFYLLIGWNSNWERDWDRVLEWIGSEPANRAPGGRL